MKYNICFPLCLCKNVGGGGNNKMSCETFDIRCGSKVIMLNMPRYGGIDSNLNMDTEIFNFVDREYEIIDKELDSESITFIGYEIIPKKLEVGICFPLCFPIQFFEKVTFLETCAKNNEEIEISGISNKIDGVYKIKKLSYRYVSGAVDCFEWILSVEYIRGV